MSVLLVTNHVPPEREGAFAALHARVGIELALFGGRSHHATEGLADPDVPHRHVAQREVHGLAASGEFSAVVCGTAGRLALPGAFSGARRVGARFVLWSALWAQPRSPAHAAGALLLRRIYTQADAVAVYGPHVAAHARARGARRTVLAPQAVDQAFWTVPGDPAAAPARTAGRTRFLFVGRDAPGKGLDVLLGAWSASGLGEGEAELLVIGPAEAPEMPAGASAHPAVSAPLLRNFYASADVLVVPSIATATFREPWGLVANEAMHQGLPIIATDAVGAAAGGLVRHERNGLVVPSSDVEALSGALRRLQEEPAARRRFGTHARRDAAPFTFAAWADGMAEAIDPH